MKINKRKTKILVASRKGTQADCMLGGEKIENVDAFTFLGSKITSDGKSYTEIWSRINQAKTAFNKKHALLTSNSMTIQLRKRLIKTFVWSVLLYGSETWTIGERGQKRIEAFEMW
uniref:Uncharacterized transposon-derived protein F52C9.6 n=1 Tax=Lygus hesperus TaxID=30085 RepID=A0A0A9ZCW4_LYGHE